MPFKQKGVVSVTNPFSDHEVYGLFNSYEDATFTLFGYKPYAEVWCYDADGGPIIMLGDFSLKDYVDAPPHAILYWHGPPILNKHLDYMEYIRAKNAGEKYYKGEGKCRNGHTNIMRYVSDRECVECRKAHDKRKRQSSRTS